MTNQFAGHSSQVNTVQMDDMKVVSGGDDGFVRVWDLRMSKKLWEIHNRYLECRKSTVVPLLIRPLPLFYH